MVRKPACAWADRVVATLALICMKSVPQQRAVWQRWGCTVMANYFVGECLTRGSAKGEGRSESLPRLLQMRWGAFVENALSETLSALKVPQFDKVCDKASDKVAFVLTTAAMWNRL